MGSARSVTRRDFLKSAAAGAAALAAAPLSSQASAPERSVPAAVPISPEAELRALSASEVLTAERTGSDHMVDVIKSLDIEYACANPGSSFRGLHESIVNYGGNRSPEFILRDYVKWTTFPPPSPISPSPRRAPTRWR